MPTTAFQSFTNSRCVPYYQHGDIPAVRQDYAFPASVTYPAGTLLGEVTGNATQTLTVTATGGSYKLIFGGQTTTAIAFNANAATIQAALVALSSIGAGNVAVTSTGPWTITFQGALGESVQPLITVDNTLATGGTAAVTAGTAGIAGQMKAYATGNTDGSQIVRGILEYALTTDASGNVTWAGGMWGETRPYAPVWISGYFRAEDLTISDSSGNKSVLDANSVAPATTASRLSQVSGNLQVGVMSLR